MGNNTLLNHNQLDQLTQFVTKHKIQEIQLNQAESRYFFDFLDQGKVLDSSRILLQPAFAQGIIRIKHTNMKVIIIPRRRLLRSTKIQWEDGFDQTNNSHINPFTKRFFEIFMAKMGYDLLLTKLADQLNNQFPLSQGQAKAIILKQLGFKLTSGTRSFLHDLRNKIRKYQDLIVNFQEYVILPHDDVKLTPQTFVEEFKFKFSTGGVSSHLEHITPTPNIKGSKLIINELLQKRDEIVKSEEMPKLEKRFFLQDSPEFEYFCTVCNYSKLIDKQQLDDDRLIQTPQHCENSMIVRLKSSK